MSLDDSSKSAFWLGNCLTPRVYNLVVGKPKMMLEEESISRRPPANLRLSDENLFANDMWAKLLPAKIHLVPMALISGNLVRTNDSTFDLRKASNPRRIEQKLRDSAEVIASPLRKKVTSSGQLWIADHYSKNYFHWLMDALPKLVFARSVGLCEPIILPRELEKIDFIAESLDLLGEEYSFLPEKSHCRAENLLVPELTSRSGNPRPGLVKLLREKLTNGATVHDPRIVNVERKIWILRDQTSKRLLENQAGLNDLIEGYGFEIINPSKIGFREQVRLFSAAKVIAGVHGAGLANMLFMNPGSAVLEIRPPRDRKNNCYFSLASALDHKYFYVSGKSTRRHRNSSLVMAPESLEVALKDLQQDGVI